MRSAEQIAVCITSLVPTTQPGGFRRFCIGREKARGRSTAVFSAETDHKRGARLEKLERNRPNMMVSAIHEIRRVQ